MPGSMEIVRSIAQKEFNHIMKGLITRVRANARQSPLVREPRLGTSRVRCVSSGDNDGTGELKKSVQSGA